MPKGENNVEWAPGNNEEKEHIRVIRKYINSAIYVEKSVSEVPLSRKTSPLSSSDEDISRQSTFRFNPYRKSAKDISPFSSESPHFKNIISTSPEKVDTRQPESGYSTNNEQSISCSDGSQITVKPANDLNSELKLSLTCFNNDQTDRFSILSLKEREDVVQSWILRKQQEKRQREIREAKLAKEKQEERQRLIEKEKENFKTWLATKKKEEEKKKMGRELEEQQEKLREVEKEKRKVENDISFSLWLRRKKKTDLEGKIREKIALLHLYEEKQRRLEENEKAYKEWLKNARFRQKPIPMNRGLQSLCSSTSVTYINPVPWRPNIDIPSRYQSSH